MKTAGYVKVAVPECDSCNCPYECELFHFHLTCKRAIRATWKLAKGNKPLKLPGPTCPAHSTVPNPWADEFPDRPWSDEAEDALIEAQLERMKRK